jgi:hypothetical protein
MLRLQVGGDRQALVERPDDGLEDRRHGQAGVGLHFRQVLVGQGQRIGTRGLEAGRIAGGSLVIGNHRLAAAGVAGDGVGGDLRGGRQQPGFDQRAQGQDEGRGMAARVGDALGGLDLAR